MYHWKCQGHENKEKLKKLSELKKAKRQLNAMWDSRLNSLEWKQMLGIVETSLESKY